MTTPLLSLAEVSLQIPMRPQPLVSDMSFAIKPQDFVVLLGSNGSGKSSLIKLMNRTLQPTAGNISLSGKQLQRYSNNEFAKKVMTVTQSSRDSLFVDMTVFENAQLWEMRTSENKLGRKQLREEVRDYLHVISPKLASSLDTPVTYLSGGEQQILTLALCLRHKPDVLLLDEHTSALDPKTSERTMQRTAAAVKELDLTCIMTTHNLDYAMQYGNRLLALADGKIVHQADYEAKDSLDRHELLELCYH